ncbi:hypothetical protein ACWDSD_45705 [Streptomyces spiralis]
MTWPGRLLTGRSAHTLPLIPSPDGRQVTDAYVSAAGVINCPPATRFSARGQYAARARWPRCTARPRPPGAPPGDPHRPLLCLCRIPAPVRLMETCCARCGHRATPCPLRRRRAEIIDLCAFNGVRADLASGRGRPVEQCERMQRYLAARTARFGARGVPAPPGMPPFQAAAVHLLDASA